MTDQSRGPSQVLCSACVLVSFVILSVVVPKAQQTVLLSGSVVDAETGDPIRGAHVYSTAGTVGWTDADGTFEGVPNQGTVQIAKAGYVNVILGNAPTGRRDAR